ncbi:MAG: hypothetical protein ABFD79_01210 [Phycisphaerales bacterium]
MSDIENKESGSDKWQNLYATMTIFTAKAPKLINSIEEAVNSKSMGELEDLATKLIVYSNNAQLEGFTQRVKNLIIAARENKIQTAKQHSDSLKECFQKMTKMTASPV